MRPKLSIVATPKKVAKPYQPLECPNCASRDAIEVRNGARREGGQVVGGAKIWLCAHCLMQGKRVVLAT